MAKEDKRSLLAKVVKFVRNPTTDWADLDQASTFEPSGHSQLMLKEMMERKKRNDFVRRREFDMLRKIRRREQVQGAMPVERASFFQSSLPSNQAERANTLKKIDEIEAQMSMQWWKTKVRDASLGSVSSVTSSVFSRHPEAPVPPAAAQETTIAAPLAAAAAQAARAPAPAPMASSAPGLEPSGGTSPQPAAAPSTNTFASTQSGAIEVHEVAHDPEMEEVYIRFAGGDVPGAEAALLDLLARESAARDPIETWMTLFDLYRATGQQERFERAALDFASQFQRSAPQWWSMPSLAQSRRAAQAGSGSAALHWSSPGRLNAAAVMGLRQRLEKTAQPWRLDWSPLQSIEPDALPSLHLLFSDWAAEPVEVHMVGADGLLELLAAAAPSGDRSIDARWWHVRLSLLRAMGRADEFELAALDYCVTYEVSPPSWRRRAGVTAASTPKAWSKKERTPSSGSQKTRLRRLLRGQGSNPRILEPAASNRGCSGPPRWNSAVSWSGTSRRRCARSPNVWRGPNFPSFLAGRWLGSTSLQRVNCSTGSASSKRKAGRCISSRSIAWSQASSACWALRTWPKSPRASIEPTLRQR